MPQIYSESLKPEIMKRSYLIPVLLVLTTLPGCLVSSLHPFYKQKDKYFDPVMSGAWVDGDSSIWTIQAHEVSEEFFGPSRPDSTYLITYYEEKNKAGLFVGTLFRIKGVVYVDFYPDPDEEHCSTELTSWHHFPTHTLARVQYNRDSILLYWFGQEWLNELFEQSRIRIPHETVEVLPDYPRHILTASTEELQKFIRKYASDPKTSEEIEQIFRRGQTEEQEEYGVFLKLKPYDGPIPSSGARQVEAD